jgi:protein AroM
VYSTRARACLPGRILRNNEPAIDGCSREDLVLGLVTLGHTPRPDFDAAFRPHAGGADVRIAGALDGLQADAVRALGRPDDPYPLLVRLAGGTTAEVPMAELAPRVAACARQLAHAGARLIVVLCAGAFEPFDCPVPVLLPGRLLPGVAAGLCHSRRAGIVVPVRGQVEPARAHWRAAGFDALVTWAAPGAAGEIEAAARVMADAGPDLVVLDCMGHDDEARRDFARRCGRPVMAAQPIVARIAGAFV